MLIGPPYILVKHDYSDFHSLTWITTCPSLSYILFYFMYAKMENV